jgi:hypothetical protein
MAEVTVGLPQETRDSKPQTLSFDKLRRYLEGSFTSEISFINDKS